MRSLQVGWLLRLHGDALTDFARNNCPYMAAGIAYWTLFSLFPLALAGFSVLGFVYSRPDAQQRAVEAVIDLVPVSADYIEGLVQEVAGARGALGTVAVIGLLLAGGAVFSAVRKGVNHAWHIGHPQYFVFERAIDLLMLLGLALVALLMDISLNAMMIGIPVVSFDEGDPVYPLTTHDFSSIMYPDRLPFFQYLAHCQWTEDEIKSGEFWEHIYPMRGPKLNEWSSNAETT